MPLIVICGIPCSGKTTKSKYLTDFLTLQLNENKIAGHVQYINDENLGYSRESYSTQKEEKKLRGSVLSAVERMLTKQDYVVVDSCNYIKGLRYQLYCIARAVSTTHCVIHVGVTLEQARQWNKPRANGYSEQTFEELSCRFEEPNSSTKWDSPLFTVLPDDKPELPCEAIWQALYERKPPPPNLSTAVKPLSDTNYLYEMDKRTNQVISHILEAQKFQGEGCLLTIPDSDVNPQGGLLTMSQLRRLRQKFINVNKSHPSIDLDRIATFFVEYLNANLH